MAKATILLQTCISYQRGSRLFQRGIPQTIEGVSEIAFYQSNPDFVVTVLEEGHDGQVEAPLPLPKAVPQVVEVQESEITDDELDAAEEKDEPLESPVKASPKKVLRKNKKGSK